jgi:hypothetical protein
VLEMRSVDSSWNWNLNVNEFGKNCRENKVKWMQEWEDIAEMHQLAAWEQDHY